MGSQVDDGRPDDSSVKVTARVEVIYAHKQHDKKLSLHEWKEKVDVYIGEMMLMNEFL